ncbi:glutamate synthase-related protein [Candidatus Zixiibacteriota bacterium]
MAQYRCEICSYIYDEESEGTAWADLPDDWVCPICGTPKSQFAEEENTTPLPVQSATPEAGYLEEWRRYADDTETSMADIHRMAETGASVIEPMRSTRTVIGWSEILIKGAQLATIPLNEDESVNTTTVIGPGADQPLVIETPLYVTHMSFGALSREAKVALARGSASVKTAMCSGEGGILEESRENSFRYIFEYVPNHYSTTEENLRQVDAIEIKIGQSAKPGMGGHLPAGKVTPEIAAIRGRSEGEDIISPARFDDITDGESLKARVDWLREKSGGRPIGVKIAAGNIEADLAVVVHAGPDFITIDGRPGATGAAARVVKDTTSVPTIFALHRARQFLDERNAEQISLVITGGLRISSDFAKALAMGADAIALGTAALMAVGCQQYRICNTGRCPVGITTHEPELTGRLDIGSSAERVASFFRVCTEELQQFARLTGNDDVHSLAVTDLCTTSSEISGHTNIEHV